MATAIKYRDDEYEPNLGDQVDVYSEDFEPETAKVIKIGKTRLWVMYDNEHIKPRCEWVDPTNCEMVCREG